MRAGAAAPGSAADLPVAAQDPLGGRELLQAHGPAGVHLLGGDAHFGAEAELAAVIGTICKDVPVSRVDDVVFGYTVGNDLTARDAQRTDLQWARAKGFDGACPLGPWIETELDVEPAGGLRTTSRLDGETRQDGTTADMVFGVRELVAAASEMFALLPGDVILTGTPGGVGTVQEGQRVEAEVEGIGILATVVRR